MWLGWVVILKCRNFALYLFRFQLIASALRDITPRWVPIGPRYHGFLRKPPKIQRNFTKIPLNYRAQAAGGTAGGRGTAGPAGSSPAPGRAPWARSASPAPWAPGSRTSRVSLSAELFAKCHCILGEFRRIFVISPLDGYPSALDTTGFAKAA